MKQSIPTCALLTAAMFLGGCLSTSPEAAAEEALGGETSGQRPGPFHRPGQPCLVCHSAEHSPGNLEYEVAGTVYDYADDSTGLGGVEVLLTDKTGNELVATTNKAGNFFVTLDSSGPSNLAGLLRIPSEFQFPLRVSVRSGDLEMQMQSLIWRNSSCADCHRGDPGAKSNGKIYLHGVTR
jgi:hypothetical protein